MDIKLETKIILGNYLVNNTFEIDDGCVALFRDTCTHTPLLSKQTNILSISINGRLWHQIRIYSDRLEFYDVQYNINYFRKIVDILVNKESYTSTFISVDAEGKLKIGQYEIDIDRNREKLHKFFMRIDSDISTYIDTNFNFYNKNKIKTQK